MRLHFIALIIVFVFFLPNLYSVERTLEISSIFPDNFQCSGNCVDNLLTEDNASLSMTKAKNALEISWNRPQGNLIINSLNIILSIRACEIEFKCDGFFNYRIEVWSGDDWQLVESFSGNSRITLDVKKSMKFDEFYKARIINLNAPLLEVDQFNLEGDFEEPQNTITLRDIYEENSVWINRIASAFLLAISVILIIYFVKKLKIFEKRKKEDSLAKNLSQYEKLSGEIKNTELKLSSIERSREELQKRYYSRDIGENAFKEMMQKYEQERVNLKHELEELNNRLKSLVI